MEAAEALALQAASNRARAGAGARPSDLAPVGEDAEALLSLAVEEKREKVRKLWIGNDGEGKLLDLGIRCSPRCSRRTGP